MVTIRAPNGGAKIPITGETPGIVRITGDERSRPVDLTVAKYGQEKRLTVSRNKEITVNAILHHPFISGILQQFDPLLLGRHTPPTAPRGGGIIATLQSSQVVSEAASAVVRLTTVLRQRPH